MYYSIYTGLRINFDKPVMVPVSNRHEKIQTLYGSFGCKVGSFPFNYLGIPLGLAKPRIEEFQPIMQRIEKRLPGYSTLLSYGDKSTLIKYVVSSLLVFFMRTLALLVGVWSKSTSIQDTTFGGNMTATS